MTNCCVFVAFRKGYFLNALEQSLLQWYATMQNIILYSNTFLVLDICCEHQYYYETFLALNTAIRSIKFVIGVPNANAYGKYYGQKYSYILTIHNYNCTHMYFFHALLPSLLIATTIRLHISITQVNIGCRESSCCLL